MNGRSMLAQVLAGAVLASRLCGAPSLQAAEKKKSSRAASRQTGRTFGIVTAKTEKDLAKAGSKR